MREKPIVIKDGWLPAGRGLTLYPFIIIDNPMYPERTFKHECKHWHQMRRMGVAKFYWEILREYVSVGRYAGPLEQEAYLYRMEPLTDEEKEWWDG